MIDTAKLIAQAREYAAHRDDPKRGQPPGQSELLRTLAAALEAIEGDRDLKAEGEEQALEAAYDWRAKAKAAEAEVEKAHTAMTHWLGEANRTEAENRRLRDELDRANATKRQLIREKGEWAEPL